MTLDEKIRNTILEDVQKIDMLFFENYVKTNSSSLRSLYDQGIIDDNSIEVALERAVFRQARSDYRTMSGPSKPYVIYADHCARPDCLAYALHKGKFSEKEIKKIPFDHGDTVDSFKKQYLREDLLLCLREQLIGI